MRTTCATLFCGAAAAYNVAPLVHNAQQQQQVSRSAAVLMGEQGIVKLGTRGSPLALAQAYETQRRLGEAFPGELDHEGAVEICVIKTTGDMVLDKALKDVGGKGLFTKELDVQLLNGGVDICVHSMKDVPTWLVPGTILPCNLPREDTRDAFISGGDAKSPAELPDGAVIGTASLRRQAQLYAINPTFKCVNFRGNVQTRLKKLSEGIVDATMLAKAGLNRMNLEEHITAVLEWDTCLPAVAQGAIGIQCREGDEKIMRYLDALNDPATKTAVDCERAFLAALDGNCRTPIAGQAKLVGDELEFSGLIAKPDGSIIYRTTRKGPADTAVAMGTDAGNELKEKVDGDALAFFGDAEILPEPKSSITGVETDGLGGYTKGEYAMDDSGKDPGFATAGK